MKQLLILLFCVMMLASCSKDKENTNTSNIESLSDDLDTAELEKDEMFGAVLTNDFLGMEDEDLETYLITQIYPLVSTERLFPILL
jgi:hypothetical protein